MANASIGAIGRACFDKLNNRTKTFDTQIRKTIFDVEKKIDNSLVECQGSRMSLRVVVSADVPKRQLRGISCEREGCLVECEAIVPINNDLNIVYYGWNSDTRRTVRRLRNDEESLLFRVCARNGKSHYDYTGYELQVDGEWSEADVDRLIDIYSQTFSSYLVPFTRESVSEMLQTNLVVAVRHDGHIVAIAMGEIAECQIGDKPITLCEISEVATHPEFQRRGLSHLAFGRLLACLHERQIDVIFSETRAASYGMMAVAWDAGMKPVGRLDQHCLISSVFSEVDQEGVYGDLVVFAIVEK